MNKTVAVVGGGYGGSLVAQALDPIADVVLIDPREAFVNVAASLRALTRPTWAHNAFFPFDTLLTRGRVVRAAAVGLDAGGIELATGGRIDADYVVLATGSTYPYPARPREERTIVEHAVRDLGETHDQLALAARVLILGAGPVGLELAGEIREVWPDKAITVVGRGAQLLPGYLPEVSEDLRRQLAELRVDLRLGTSLATPPSVPDGRFERFAVTTDAGDEIEADIWFTSFGAEVNTGWLRASSVVSLTDDGLVPVDEHLNVVGQGRIFALGDIADLTDPKMATWAQTQAPVVIENITGMLEGRAPAAVYESATQQRIFLPLGTNAGVGQLPHPLGSVAPAPLQTVIDRKGADLFTARFATRFRRA
jgi:NADH dehydrogenase FAD-containing subunit